MTVVGVVLLGVSGCSSNVYGNNTTATNTNTNTTPGTYAITVTAPSTTATGSVVTHTSNVSFVVQ